MRNHFMNSKERKTKAPLKKPKAGFRYPDFAEFRLLHNPGYDFMRLLRWADEVDPDKFNQVFAEYLRPAISVVAACCAIEGYLNMAGQSLDKDWIRFAKGKVSVKDKIKRIYALLNQKVDFNSGLFQEVIAMFKRRNSLVHPCFVDKTEERSSPIPDIFDQIETEFAPSRCRRVAEGFRKKLLRDSHLGDVWHRLRYEERRLPSKYNLESSG